MSLKDRFEGCVKPFECNTSELELYLEYYVMGYFQQGSNMS